MVSGKKPPQEKEEAVGTLLVGGEPVATVHGYSYDTHSSTHTHSYTATTDSTSHSNLYWNDHTNTWTYSGTFTNDYWDTLIKFPQYEQAWLPMVCQCCDELVLRADDDCVLQIGTESLHFHRRCFADKENSAFIRSLLISKDLDLI